ncbi:BPTI/Kunitz domain-containing protein-like isoform X2 [Haliotis rufescens]|uniref:BPTI/Kunitz domain-containing protein-like isoform X2 n=2 Tax=Haliotis rufescens TaxID=6454 RepID=UPI00201F58B6|nr:BPTI/Kunitz domain-containing protein-like isoform X2 [Haliotis rufescens]
MPFADHDRIMALSFCQLCLVVIVVGLTSAWKPNLCQLPKDPGPCYAYDPQYYYNSQTCLCEKFVYGGCFGNANRFDTLEDCRYRCGGGDLCSLPRDQGPCDVVVRRWWYNKRTNRCQLFSYGSCKGNANNFKTLDECRFQCRWGRPW